MSKYVGKGVGRVDALLKSQGKAVYAGDHYEENMLFIHVVRSPHGHANIKKIDVSKVPSDIVAITGHDLPVNIVTYMVDDQQVLATDKVRFFGEPLVLLAADTLERAKEGAAYVDIEYEELKSCTNAKEALMPGAPLIHEGGNLMMPFIFDRGDVASAFQNADLIIEEDFELPTQEHIYMEPEAAFSRYNGDVLETYVSTQNVFLDKRGIVRTLNLPKDKVEVIAKAVGGAFGGKAGHIIQSFPAIVTWKTKRPSKLICSRRESIAGSFKRHAGQVHIKFAFNKKGEMLAFESDMFLDTGAYTSYGPAVLGMMSEHMPGPYKVANVKLNNMLCYTNRAPASAMRGFGAPQAAYMMETIMNKAARKLGLDLVDIRLINALETGDINCLGETMEFSVGLKEALKIVKNSDLWKERETNKDPLIGYGIAAGHIGVGMGRNCHDMAKVDILQYEEGKYRIYCGTVDMGQGSITGLTQIAAEYLDVPMENVEMVMSDTSLTYDCNDTVASRSAYIGGNAIIAAVDNFRKNPCIGVRVSGEAYYPESKVDLNLIGLPHSMFAFMAQAAKVKIDAVTGKITVLEVFGATEAGRILNPVAVEGQICGGILMSMGYALTEELNYVDGKPVENTMSKYIVATSLDMPKMSSVNVESYEKTGPYGVKGVGEIATVAITPAIADAVKSIVDIDVNKIPLNAEAVLDALAKNKLKEDYI